VPEAPLAPHTVDDVTPEWLDAVLRHHGTLADAHVVGVRFEQIDLVDGFLAETVRLVPKYDHEAPGAPKAILAKFATRKESTRQFMFESGLYAREGQFYTLLAPFCEVPTPVCYFSGYDGEEQRVCLLIEYLTEAQVGDELKETSVEDIELALDSVSLLHSSCWEGNSAFDTSWVSSTAGIKPIGNGADWRDFPDDLQHVLPAAIRPIGDRLHDEFESLVRPYLLNSRPQTINHGDFRLANILYDRSGRSSSVTLVDWQTVGRCNVALDLGWFFGLGLSVEQRRIQEELLLRQYHQGLLAGGVPDYGFEDCWRDYRLGILNAFWRAVGAQNLLRGGIRERGDRLRAAFIERTATAVLDLECAKLLDELAAE
jgi:aminoglycoside phosphotransferase (APT) family kinase protein